jgi:tetratricopeptide (TPR) repeat protein
VGYERTANNDFVQAWSETGWLGLLAWCAPLGWFGARLVRGRHPDALGGTAALLVAAMADSPLQRGSTWVLLWLWLGMAWEPAPAAMALTTPPRRILRTVVAAMVAVLSGWMALRPVLASYWAGVGTNLEAQGNYAEAVPIYRRAMSLDPSASSAAFNLPRALALSGDLAGAERASLEAIHWINEPEVLLLRLRILERRRPRLEALLEAGKAVQEFPYSTELRAEFLKLSPVFH